MEIKEIKPEVVVSRKIEELDLELFILLSCPILRFFGGLGKKFQNSKFC